MGFHFARAVVVENNDELQTARHLTDPEPLLWLFLSVTSQCCPYHSEDTVDESYRDELPRVVPRTPKSESATKVELP
jgi:hypothetical protein